jgi:WD40 repeat protein
VPAANPWPASEPVVTLPSGDIARLVNGRTVQVCSAKTGDLTQTTIAPLNVATAKPSAITMQTRPDGTVFITKPGIGRAIIADPADSFRVKTEISFPVPTSPLGAPLSKAVLSASGDTLYVLGAAKTGGVSAYDVATGKLTASYSHGGGYSGLYLLPSGTLLAVSAANPRLTFYSSSLSPLGTAETSLQISAAF